jgi:hypothetical protein
MPATLTTDTGFSNRLADLGMASRTLFRADEVATIFDVSDDTVYRWTQGPLDGAIDVSAGSSKRPKLRFTRASIERFWNRRTLL